MAYSNDEKPLGLDPAPTAGPTDVLVGQRDGETDAESFSVLLLAMSILEIISDDDPDLTQSNDLLPTQSAVRSYVRAALFSDVETDAGSNRDIVNQDAGLYLRMTNGSAKTVTFDTDAMVPLDDDVEFHIRCVGADLTLVGASGVDLNPPSGGTLVLSDGMTVTVKRVAVDEFDVIGQTVPV